MAVLPRPTASVVADVDAAVEVAAVPVGEEVKAEETEAELPKPAAVP